MASSSATFIFLSFCIGTTAADCTYVHKHYDNETATYREDILYRQCRRTEECCGNYTDRRCCSLSSQKTSSVTESSQHAPALLLAGITTALVVIGVIAIFCWRLVCISAYKEASGLHIRSHGADARHRRGLTSRTQDNNADSPRQGRGQVANHGHHHGLHGHHHRVHVTPPRPHHAVPVAPPDEHLTGLRPPAYTKEAPSAASKYLAPPSYEDSVTVKEIDPPPAYTLQTTMHQDEDIERSHDLES